MAQEMTAARRRIVALNALRYKGHSDALVEFPEAAWAMGLTHVMPKMSYDLRQWAEWQRRETLQKLIKERRFTELESFPEWKGVIANLAPVSKRSMDSIRAALPLRMTEPAPRTNRRSKTKYRRRKNQWDRPGGGAEHRLQTMVTSMVGVPLQTEAFTSTQIRKAMSGFGPIYL